MGRDDPFFTRYATLDPMPSGRYDQATINRLGVQVQTNFLTQMILSGFGYHIQAGTEDAGAAANNGPIDDQLAFMVADQRAGNVMFPLLYEVTPGSIGDAATIVQAMLECDKAKTRYSSAGTTFAPTNLNDSNQGTFSGVAYAGGDIVTLAKSTVPDSVELARRDIFEDALNDKLGYPGWWKTEVYSARKRPLCILHNASSIVAHLGSVINVTGLVTGYGVLELVQFPRTYIV